MKPPDFCPNCGAEVPPGAKACPECGADEKTGWSEQARYDHLDLPDDDFDHDEFVKREFGPESIKPYGIAGFWWVIALFLIVLATIVFLSGIPGRW
ncbi:MAG TPA: zinc ribbon domain-containing protein [Candidatus Sulfopaludibacter sp.]|nr:zinc ribbon domain-containing protein [Candidatus Sulfopaludibacter sp.]